MIKITVELWPFGDESNKKTIATAKIWNDGTGSPFTGSYGYELSGANNQEMKVGFLGEYKRRDFHVWWLIAAVLREAFPNVAKAFRDGTIRHKEKK